MLDTAFLEECGLGGLDGPDKESLLARVTLELESRVGARLSEGMTPAELGEFDALTGTDPARVRRWLAAHRVECEADASWQALIRRADGRPVPPDVAADYAATLWLRLHRPGYRDTVADVLAQLRDELRAFSARIIPGVALDPAGAAPAGGAR